MGLDLDLLPFAHPRMSPINTFSHDILDMARATHAFWDLVRAIEKKWGQRVPADFATYRSRQNDKESHYGPTQETPYGELLLWVEARHLKPLRDHECVQDNWRNRGIWAFIMEMPDDLPIALYWH